jgi:type IV pilus assembly protein PilQ
MEIKASNDYADYARAASLQNNPPINKSEIESTVVVRDGDTIVIGGIMKTTDTEAVTGVPWFHKIPVLGWLFKTEDITKKKTQLLIFVTPKIINSADTAFVDPVLMASEG